MGKQDTMGDREVTALLQSALAGASRAALLQALVSGLQEGHDSPNTSLIVSLR